MEKPVIITPTVGRMVWFREYGSKIADQPNAAVVTFVNNDRNVNLSVFDAVGQQRGVAGVRLVQDGDVPPVSPQGYCTVEHCTWMPYQKGQAAKTEAAEAALAKTAG